MTNLLIDGGDLGRTNGILPAEAGPNLVSNPSFETNTTGWAVVGGAALARVTTDSVSNGAACLDVTVTASGGGASTPVALVAGTAYTLEVYVKVPTGKTVTVRFVDAGGTPANASLVIAGITGGWQYASVTYVSGGGALSIQVFDSVASSYPYDMFIDLARVAVRSSRISNSILNAPTSLV